jgi:hypothetical protein
MNQLSNYIFYLENRKKYTKYVVENTSYLLSKFIGNSFFAGCLLILFHINSVLFVLYNLITCEVVSSYHFYTFCWIIIIYSNYYFHGCLLAKIEQYLLQDKSWSGPINIMLYPLHLFYKPNKQIMNDYIKFFWATPISIFIILKYLFHDNITNKFIGLVFFTLLTPLLFIHSQYDIFKYLYIIPFLT